MKNKRVILTGGIASGKSTVSKYFSENGFKIIDVDEISRTIFRENYDNLCELFDYKNRDLRTFLSDNVFKDKSLLQKLESFMHPKISDVIDEMHKTYQKQNIPHIIDNPIHFEKFRQDKNDFVILVFVSYEVQLKRLMERNGYTKEVADDRIFSQMKTEDKIKLSNIVIENNGTLEGLYKNIDSIIETLKKG